jgi:hypothetical protein
MPIQAINAALFSKFFTGLLFVHHSITLTTHVTNVQLGWCNFSTNPWLLIARDRYMFRSLQFSMASKPMPWISLWKGVTGHFLGVQSTSLAVGNSVTLLTATRFFASKLLTPTFRPFSSIIFLFCEICNHTEANSIQNISNYPNSYLVIDVCCCRLEFQSLSVPIQSRLPSRLTLPPLSVNLRSQPSFFLGTQQVSRQ